MQSPLAFFCECEAGEPVLSAIVPPAFAPYEGGIDSVIRVDLKCLKVIEVIVVTIFTLICNIMTPLFYLISRHL